MKIKCINDRPKSNFEKDIKQYIINMNKTSGRRTVHKKNTKSCYQSKHLPYEYLDFDSLNEIEEYINDYKLCQKCFDIKKISN